jgi:bifunctional DNase/RNase
MLVLMKLARIILNELTEQNLIVLQEVDGERELVIAIGAFEARSIEYRARRERSPRPQTHDLLIHAIQEMGGEVDSVAIVELHEKTYFARLRIRQGNELLELDSRPSDAVAVATTFDPPLPIYVAEAVLEEVNNQ